MNRIQKMKGFTLIELIVVVIIIGVLAAIAAVAYNTFVDNARKTSATASAKQVEKAIAAKTAMDDKSVAAEIAATPTITAASLGPMTGVDYIVFNATGPKVKVVDGTRASCLDYTGVSAGGNAVTITAITDLTNTSTGC